MFHGIVTVVDYRCEMVFRDARIISFSSIAARRGAGSYGAAKAAVEAWTADLAAELGPRGITANAVSRAWPWAASCSGTA
jgi:NAD(P)-dependent dehydrogenase (short-subunit alcohol dehydrogenase family)